MNFPKTHSGITNYRMSLGLFQPAFENWPIPKEIWKPW
jgi:hypothetical protein